MSSVQRQEDFVRRNHEAQQLTQTATAASPSAPSAAHLPSSSPRQYPPDKSSTQRELFSARSRKNDPQPGSPSQYSPSNPFGSTAKFAVAERVGDQISNAGRQGLELKGGSTDTAVTTSTAVRSTAIPSKTEAFQTKKSPDLSSIHSRQGPASLTPTPLHSASSVEETYPQRVIMPRTSSIDSAISSVSTASHPQKAAVEVREPSQEEVRHLIEAAGSSETVILHLLKEKHNAVSQNAQLWKLVDKQRALVLGLNKDLERLTKEKDRYRRKLKETQGQVSQAPLHVVRKDSQSPVRIGAANTTSTGQKDTEGLTTPDGKPQGRLQSSPIDPAMVPVPLQLQRQQQSRRPELQLMRQDTDSSVESLEETSAKPEESKDMQPIPLLISGPESDANISYADMPPFPNTSSPPLPKATRELPKMPTVQTSLGPPSLNLIEPSPLVEKPNKSFSAARKAPAPLNLKQSTLAQTVRAGDPADSPVEGGDVEESPQPGRGRRKTREEDDRDRELAVLQEQEARSLSKKEKRSKSRPEDTQPEIKETGLLPLNLQSVGLPASPRHPPPAIIDRLSPPIHISSSGQSITQEPGTTIERLLVAPLKSPGLPTSPRPSGRSMGSPLPRNPKDNTSLLSVLPLSPRGGMPLTPRAPNRPIPLPPGSQLLTTSVAPQTAPETRTQQETKNSHMPETRTLSPTEPPPIYRGFVSPAHPDLLLPPNALPSIEVKVASSRLRPSYGSSNESASAKTQEDSAVFILSIFSRSNREELWRIEKSTSALPQLDYALRPLCNNLPRLPERKLFNGHAPAVMDARRNSINLYFDELLDTPMDENTASVICHFLSTDTIDPSNHTGLTNESQSSVLAGARTISKKAGYLTKRGKNFGGWKSRYYVLEGSDLRCFESPGGQHLSTIKLLHAQIGKQSQGGSPPLPPEEADENQYRHAFLILEPKKKDSNSLMRHVLCAENDAERDGWVEALLHHVDGASGNGSGAGEESVRSPENDNGALKAVNYADTVAGSSPVDTPPTSHKATGNYTTPQTVSAPTFTNSSNQDQVTAKSAISGPTNGAVISDAASWGNKPATHAKEHKKRSMFHFRQKPSTDSVTSQPVSNNDGHNSRLVENYNGPHVFGLPLTEAVEFCSPVGVNVNLPAVVYRCIEYLRVKNAASEEGIFRLSGSNLVIKTLKERFNTEGDVDFLADGQYYDVHAIASLFKTYLRELPTSVLTRDLHLDFLHVLELEDNASKIGALNTLVHRLPAVNYSLLRTLSQYLLEVVQNCDRNKMSVRNVGIVFSPTLNIPAPICAMFLTEFDAIFSEKAAAEDQHRSVEITVPRSLSPEDIRSPRHQMFSDLPTPAYNQNAFPSTPKQGSPLNSADDVGFTPLQQSYENSRNLPASQASAPAHHPWQPFPQQPSADAAYGSLNRMMAPTNAPNAKAKRRESSMLFM